MFRMCSHVSIPTGSTELSRTHSIRREYQPHNNNLAFSCLEYRTENHTKTETAAGCQLQSVWTCTQHHYSATCSMKRRKFPCFEDWISVRLQAPYLACPHSPCQYKTWPIPYRSVNGVKIELRNIPHIGTDIWNDLMFMGPSIVIIF